MRGMRSILFLLLSSLLLGACGKAQTAADGGSAQIEMSAPDAMVDLWVDPSIPYDSVVQISINPLFLIYLDKEQKVLSVVAENEDAERVCGDIELEGNSFDQAFGKILMESYQKGYLSNDKQVEVNVLALAEGTKTYAPDIVQHAKEIVEDTAEVCNIDLHTEVLMSSRVVDMQGDTWKDNDKVAYVEKASDGADKQQGDAQDNGTSDECQVCGGIGTLTCQECNGTGELIMVCEDCKDTGYVVCSLCQGEGSCEDETLAGGTMVEEGVYVFDEPCDLCGGDTLLEGQCRYCKGTGKCTTCGGSGQEANDQGGVNPCHTCGGTGLHTNLFYGVTKACNGAAPCNRCRGTGKKTVYLEEGQTSARTCNRCEGTGQQPCMSDVHNGPVDCPACDGGVTICGNCQGTGRLIR